MWRSGISLYIVCFLPCLFWCLATAEDVLGLIPNGDFEEAPPPGAMVGNVIVVPNSLPKWETKGVVEYVSSSQEKEKEKQKQHNNNNTVLHLVGSGVRLGNGGKVSQRIDGLKKDSLYSLSFSAGSTCETESLNVTVVSYEPQFVPMETGRLNSYGWTFTAKHHTHQLIFHNPAKNLQHPNCGPVIDGVGIKELSKSYQRLRPEDQKENLLWNGDFEEGPSDFGLNGTNGILVFPEHNNFYSLESPVPGWKIQSLKPAKYIDSAHFKVPQGSRAVQLLESVLYQSRYAEFLAKHRLTFAVGDAGNGCKGAMVVQVFNGKEKFKVPYTSNGTGGFTTATFEYFNPGWDTTSVAFTSDFIGADNSGAPCGPVVDDVKLVPLS